MLAISSSSGSLFTAGPAHDFLKALGKHERTARFRAFPPKSSLNNPDISAKMGQLPQF